MTMRIGCGQITWKRPPEGAGPEWDDGVLREIAEAGYAGAPANTGSRTGAETAALFGRHGLAPAPGYFSVPLSEERDAVVERAARHAAFLRELGCTELYVAAGGPYETASGKTRREIAGRVTPADAMSDGEFQEFAETVSAVGEATLREGVRVCFHNHVGGVIETPEEFARLLDYTDPATVWLGPDTGHLAWGGADVVPFLRPHADRILTLHLKDINPNVLARGRAEAWDYAQFSRAGIFAELGEGFVDFPGLFALLREARFDGWLIVETDVTQKASPLESATISRAYLRDVIGV